MVNQRELYHRILDVPRGTSLQGLRTAYKGLAKKWHPDKHPPASKPEAEARFKAITEAYEALLDQRTVAPPTVGILRETSDLQLLIRNNYVRVADSSPSQVAAVARVSLAHNDQIQQSIDSTCPSPRILSASDRC
ncbi:hypothetical protein ZWY2020_050149 [Hordeum vulgare]|nr:hypothetical protein ZWY2020_050149 [Hordeum vulgare]